MSLFSSVFQSIMTICLLQPLSECEYEHSIPLGGSTHSYESSDSDTSWRGDEVLFGGGNIYRMATYKGDYYRPLQGIQLYCILLRTNHGDSKSRDTA